MDSPNYQIVKAVNPKAEDDKKLTFTELRSCKGFEQLTDEQATEVIDFLHTFCIRAYRTYIQNLNNEYHED